MTTLVNFVPSPNLPFTFQATLDGGTYTAIVSWNLFGQRWYLALYTLSGVLVLNIAMVGSPLDRDISLTKGYFTTTLVWRVDNNQFEIG